jgi:hypothetical protein
MMIIERYMSHPKLGFRVTYYSDYNKVENEIVDDLLVKDGWTIHKHEIALKTSDSTDICWLLETIAYRFFEQGLQTREGNLPIDTLN